MSFLVSPRFPFDSNCIREICPIIESTREFHKLTTIDLIRFCMSSNCFIFKDTFFKQINCTAMGSRFSVTIAEIVMQYIANNIIHKLSHTLKIWRRYVHDVFVVPETENLPTILDIANSICPSIQFIIEYESNCRIPLP